MVGNSPKSDVLPALAAGLGVVFIPHAATWTLELAALPGPYATTACVVVERFSDLLQHF